MKVIFLVVALFGALCCAEDGLAQTRIVGGQGVASAAFPFMVTLQRYGIINYVHHCGASILSETWLISAARCTQETGAISRYRITGGVIVLDQVTTSVQRANVAEFVNHPEFNSNTGANDISLIRLASNLQFTNWIQPITIVQPIIGVEAILVGWGNNGRTAGSSYYLQSASLPVLEQTACRVAVRDYLIGQELTFNPTSNICTGALAGPVTGCAGDEGSPLVQDGLLVGVASHVFAPCGEVTAPVIYTKPVEYIRWIQTYIPDA